MKIESIEFINGSTPSGPPLTIEPKQITVFIGPNNGGKSTTLRELYSYFNYDNRTEYITVSRISTSRITLNAAKEKINSLKSYSNEGLPASNVSLNWMGHAESVSINYLMSQIEAYTEHDSLEGLDERFITNWLLRPFALNLNGETRLQLVNPQHSLDLLDRPHSTIGRIFINDELRRRLCKVINEAFQLHLTINPTRTSQLSYALCDRPALSIDIERSLTQEAIEYFRSSRPLAAASDGTKAFIGVISEVLAGEADVLFIDEPEAFLHPGLAFLLGREIASNITSSKQLFAATHSPQFLMGCLSTGTPVDVVRLTHRIGSGTAQVLSSEKLSEIMDDPLMRSVGVVSAMFYEGAVIVEGDSDRAFYEEINNRLSRFDPPGVRHCIFLNAHSKQKSADIAYHIRSIGIPAAIILDIDWIKEDGQVADKYFAAAGIPAGALEGIKSQRRSVRQTLEEASPAYKRNGGTKNLSKQDLDAANLLFDLMEQYGMFTVRSGELESWLGYIDVPRTKGSWIPNIFSALGSDPGLPEYVKPSGGDVWDFMRRVAKWQLTS